MPYHNWRNALSLRRSDRLFSSMPWIVAGSYMVLGAAWIAFSDRVLVGIAGSYRQYQDFETYKGWCFIALSALLMLMILKGAWKKILEFYESARESEHRLQLALAGAGGGAWEKDLGDRGEMFSYVSPELTSRLGLPATGGFSVSHWRERRHPDDVEMLDRAMKDLLRSGGREPYDVRFRMLGADGSYRWINSRGNVARNERGRVEKVVGVALDITDRVRAEERVQQLLRYDPATGLAKQSKFLSAVDEILGDAYAGTFLAVAQVKLVSLDHLVADSETAEDAAIVRAVGDALLQLSEDGFQASRIATDIFAVATPLAQSRQAVQRSMQRVLDLFAQPRDVEGRRVRLRFHAGGALYPLDGDNAFTLLRNSGHALDKTERAADSGVRWFTEGLDAEFRERSELLSALGNAVSNGEIECYFQPVVAMASGRTAGFEALVRWRREGEGVVPPDRFIPLAEEFGQISAIGEEVLRQACRAAAVWPTVKGQAPFVAVNVSPVQLNDPAFPELIARVLAESGLPPSRLELEITENMLAQDEQAAGQRLESLRRLGVYVAIDDFGTGYSSLALLGKLPFTRLKIDKSFIAGYGNDGASTSIVDLVIDLCGALGLSVTVEGVETETQASLLAAKGVELAQGYLFSRPVPLCELAALHGRAWPVCRAAGGRRRTASGRGR